MDQNKSEWKYFFTGFSGPTNFSGPAWVLLPWAVRSQSSPGILDFSLLEIPSRDKVTFGSFEVFLSRQERELSENGE